MSDASQYYDKQTDLLLRLQPGERALGVERRLLALPVGAVGRREVKLGEHHLALLVEHLVGKER